MPDALPGWKVTGISPGVKFVPGFPPVNGLDVHFTLTSGVESTVFVPEAQAGDINAINYAIQAKVEQLHAIHSLSG